MTWPLSVIVSNKYKPKHNLHTFTLSADAAVHTRHITACVSLKLYICYHGAFIFHAFDVLPVNILCKIHIIICTSSVLIYIFSHRIKTLLYMQIRLLDVGIFTLKHVT